MFRCFGVLWRRRFAAAISLLAGSASFAGTTVQAATVSGNGDGVINRGLGFKSFQSGETSSQGDVVLARTSSVMVAYPNGCVVEVKAGATYIIETPEQCVSASTTSSPLSSALTITPTGVLAAGALAGGIAAGVILSGNSSSASP